MRNKTLLIALAALAFVGAGCSFGAQPLTLTPVTLTYWRSQDDPAAFKTVTDAYRKVRPNVTIAYRDIPAADYERTLLDALAIDKGPDMFSIPVTWLGGWKAKITPMPAETTILTQTVNAQKQLTVVKQKSATMSLLDLRNRFVEGVTKDVVFTVPATVAGAQPTQGIWALPYSFDTLGLYYNRTLLKNAGYDKPPASWQDVSDMAGKLTILGKDGAIAQSGAAIGGGKNVLHATDIVTALMAQDGATIADDAGYAHFHTYPPGQSGGSQYPPGLQALLYYESFANQGTPNYSWNDSMPLSLDAFVTGRAAFFFGFPADAAVIRMRAPGLDFGVAPLPQIDPSAPKNLASYPVEVVSKKSKNADIAWDFLQFATRQEQVSAWLTAVKRPTALRNLIAGQLTDPNIAPFAGQILTGRSWYKGKDWAAVENVFNALIAKRPTERQPDYQPYLTQAAQAVDATMR
ncbi:MAG: hypothetical protein RLZZ324_300 [Candidatus Parcubacteria bacterium]|jgi:ABC-type glycerol-3-phosphate transport system substrate-binding protein